MTSDRRIVLCVTLPMLIAVLWGCSREQTSASQSGAAITPSVDQHQATPADVLTARVSAGGIPTTYQAYFTAGQLTRVSETRASAAGETVRGDYEFRGARLLKYIGPSVRGTSVLELEFDLQGRVVVSRAGAGTAGAEEISEVRGRAQLLRSHALTQRATRSHAMK